MKEVICTSIYVNSGAFRLGPHMFISSQFFFLSHLRVPNSDIVRCGGISIIKHFSQFRHILLRSSRNDNIIDLNQYVSPKPPPASPNVDHKRKKHFQNIPFTFHQWFYFVQFSPVQFLFIKTLITRIAASTLGTVSVDTVFRAGVMHFGGGILTYMLQRQDNLLIFCHFQPWI